MSEGHDGLNSPAEMREPALLLCRHGQSTWNAAGRWQGQGDPPLSVRGREQAAGLGRELATLGVVGLVASDLVRARETARIVAAALGIEPSLDPRLRELDVGAWSGLTRDEIAAAHPEDLARFLEGSDAARPTRGESRSELRVRVAPVLVALAQRARERGPIAVVTHLGVIRAVGAAGYLANAAWCRWRAPR